MKMRTRIAAFFALVAIMTMALSPLAFAKGGGGGGAEGGKWTNRPEGQPGWSQPAPGPKG